MIRIALDLELNCDGTNPTEEIIQVGYCAFDTETGNILEVAGDYVCISKPLHPYITTLTGITQKEIDDQGVSLEQAYKNLMSFFEKHDAGFRQIITWGGGDLSALKDELTFKGFTGWTLGRSECNAKAIYQAYRVANGAKHQSGLKNSMNKVGLKWNTFKEIDLNGNTKERTAHNAKCDALNTAIMYMFLSNKLKD